MSKEWNKVTAKRKEEFEDFLEIHSMFEGRFLWEFVASAVNQSFPGITECQVMFQPKGPLLPKQAKWVSVMLTPPELWVARYTNYVD